MSIEDAMRELAEAFDAVWQAVKEVFEGTLTWLLDLFTSHPELLELKQRGEICDGSNGKI